MTPGDRFEVHIGSGRGGPRPGPRGPARVLVVGDLGGAGAAARPGLDARGALPVDVDRFDGLMARVAPRVTIPRGGSGERDLVLEFGSLDDFHPDSLVRRIPLLCELHDLRRRLLDPRTFGAAASGMREALGAASAAPPGAAPPAAPAAPPAAAESDADALARLLGRPPAPPAGLAAGSRGPDITDMIRDLVAPHVVPAPDPHQQVYVTAVEQAMGALVRALLHHARFQAVESLWRSLRFLVDRVEWGEELRLYALDVTREELTVGLPGPGAPARESGLARVLADPALENGRWLCVVVALEFAPEATDLALLESLGRVGAEVGAPVLAEASPRLLGCASLVETPDPAAWGDEASSPAAWRALRASAVAPWIGLALPRVLLRLPYGQGQDVVESFAFEEIADSTEHEAYLWGNPAFACAVVLANALQEGGEARPAEATEIADLPAHVIRDGEEARLLPCAETLLSERAIAAILARGLMPLASHARRDAVRLARLQSLAEPPAPLGGSD